MFYSTNCNAARPFCEASQLGFIRFILPKPDILSALLHLPSSPQRCVYGFYISLFPLNPTFLLPPSPLVSFPLEVKWGLKKVLH